MENRSPRLGERRRSADESDMRSLCEHQVAVAKYHKRVLIAGMVAAGVFIATLWAVSAVLGLYQANLRAALNSPAYSAVSQIIVPLTIPIGETQSGRRSVANRDDKVPQVKLRLTLASEGVMTPQFGDECRHLTSVRQAQPDLRGGTETSEFEPAINSVLVESATVEAMLMPCVANAHCMSHRISGISRDYVLNLGPGSFRQFVRRECCLSVREQNQREHLGRFLL